MFFKSEPTYTQADIDQQKLNIENRLHFYSEDDIKQLVTLSQQLQVLRDINKLKEMGGVPEFEFMLTDASIPSRYINVQLKDNVLDYFIKTK